MYVKVFSSMLDSSIWLTDSDTTKCWMTLLLSMDVDGFAKFSSPRNLARRSGLTNEATDKAIEYLEQPDADSGDKEHEGRRIERVPGGWYVLNAEKYRNLGNAEMIREGNRLRAKDYRRRKKEQSVGDASHTVTDTSRTVTKKSRQEEAEEEAYANTDKDKEKKKEKKKRSADASPRATVKKFSKPAKLEIDEYAISLGHESFDTEYFYDHYEANGWIVGKVKMKDWKATVRNWIARGKNNSSQGMSYADARSNALKPHNADYYTDRQLEEKELFALEAKSDLDKTNEELDRHAELHRKYR